MAILSRKGAVQNPHVSTPPTGTTAEKSTAATVAVAKSASESSAPSTPIVSTPVVPTASSEQRELQANIEAEVRLVTLLKSPDSLTAVERVNARIATRAIDAAVAYVQNRSDPITWSAVVKAQPKSVVDAVVKLASSGLTVSQLTGEAFLVPRYSKVEKANIVTPIPGVRGMERKLFESGKVSSIDANIVRAQDHFVANEGLNATLEYRRNLRPDLTKPNPVIGAYVVISSTENRPAKIKTLAITEREERDGHKTHHAWVANGQVLNTTRMGVEAAGIYSAQRPAMREVIRTWLHDNAELNSLVEMEDTSMRTGDEIPGAQTRIKSAPARTNTPTVAPSKVPPSPAAGVTEQTEKLDPIANAIEKARSQVPANTEESLPTAARKLTPSIL